MVYIRFLFIRDLAFWHSGKQYLASGIWKNNRHLLDCQFARLPDCRIAGLPDCLTASLPDCRFPGLPDCRFRKTQKLMIPILLSLCLLFLSGCTTRKNLKQSLFLSWPLKTTPKISRDFSLRSPHDGIDIVAPMNREIFSAHEGYVVYAGSGYNGYGRLIILDSGQGWSTFYAHLNRIFVTEGLFVQRGDIIGTVGMTGKASGPHLHFELRKNKMPVDPKRYLP